MCFDVQSPKQVAEKDIICWKVITKNLQSANMGFQYEFRKLYKQNNVSHWQDSKKRGDVISKGFHSYQLKKSASEQCWDNSIVVKCIIPKGSFYFANKRRLIYDENRYQYVSNQIKIIKKVRK